ncbi:MAG: hypothetical protein AAF560_04665 [Acidobacteriota bacterium]
MDVPPAAAKARAIETGLARWTLGCLAIYFPAETYVSQPEGLWSPFYLVDLIGMLLLGFGARRSLAARPRSAPALLGFGYAWATSNGWRATSWRSLAVADGEPLTFAIWELWAVGFGTALGLVGCGVCLWLIARAEPSSPSE